MLELKSIVFHILSLSHTSHENSDHLFVRPPEVAPLVRGPFADTLFPLFRLECFLLVHRQDMASASSLPPWSVDVWSPLAWFAWSPCLWLSVRCSHDNRPPSPWPCLPILAAGTLWLIWAPLLSESRLFLLPRTLPSFSSMWMV